MVSSSVVHGTIDKGRFSGEFLNDKRVNGIGNTR